MTTWREALTSTWAEAQMRVQAQSRAMPNVFNVGILSNAEFGREWDAMQRFYEQVIGLPLMTRFSTSAFFKIAGGYAGHTQVLALFDRSENHGYRRTDAATSTIDHIAFEIPLADFEGEKKRLEGLGLQVETAEHAWVHWRSLYVTDPEGNQVELVCYDESV